MPQSGGGGGSGSARLSAWGDGMGRQARPSLFIRRSSASVNGGTDSCTRKLRILERSSAVSTHCSSAAMASSLTLRPFSAALAASRSIRGSGTPLNVKVAIANPWLPSRDLPEGVFVRAESTRLGERNKPLAQRLELSTDKVSAERLPGDVAAAPAKARRRGRESLREGIDEGAGLHVEECATRRALEQVIRDSTATQAALDRGSRYQVTRQNTSARGPAAEGLLRRSARAFRSLPPPSQSGTGRHSGSRHDQSRFPRSVWHQPRRHEHSLGL